MPVPHGCAVLQNAGPDEKDIIATHTGSLFIAQTPEVFTYDNDGNLLTDGRWQYTWNGENRLIGMETRTNLPPETPRRKLAFLYDSQGRRTGKTVFTLNTNAQWENASTHHFLYDGWNLVSEFRSQHSGVSTNHFVWGLDLSGTPQGAGGIGGLLFMINADSQLLTPAYDANGNITEYISTNGNIAARYEYDPFGNTIAQIGPQADKLPFRFSTKYTDNESGLLYFGYRYFNPTLGRFFNRDPINENGFLRTRIGRKINHKTYASIYEYCFTRNDSVNYSDFLGLKTWTVKDCNLIIFVSHSSTAPRQIKIGKCARASFISCGRFLSNPPIIDNPMPGWEPGRKPPRDDDKPYSIGDGVGLEDDVISPKQASTLALQDFWTSVREAASMCSQQANGSGCCCKNYRVTIKCELDIFYYNAMDSGVCGKTATGRCTDGVYEPGVR